MGDISGNGLAKDERKGSKMCNRVQTLCACLLLAGLAFGSVSRGMAEEATSPTKRVKSIRVKSPAAAARLTNEAALEAAKTTGLTSDVLRLTTDYIQKYKPLLARDLENLRATNPKMYRARMVEMAQYARQLEATKDPAKRARREQYLALEAQAELAVVRYKESPEASRPQIETELKGFLDKLFDFKTEDDRAQLEEARKNLDAQQAAIEQRAKNRDRIVDRELTRMLGISETLAW